MGRSLSVDKTVGAYPVFKADDTYQKPLPAVASGIDGTIVGGFSNDGDYIALPMLAADTFDYFDNTGTQIVTSAWSGGLAVTDIDAACDTWVGPMYDAAAGLIYLCGVDTTTTPDTFYFASINAAGTLTNIGNAQVTTDFANPVTFNKSAVQPGAVCLYRTADGEGNFFVRAAVTGLVEEAEFNISTGALVTDTATIIAGHFGCPYKTANGTYINIGNHTVGNSVLAVNVAGSGTAGAYMAVDTGLPTFNTNAPYTLQWGGRIVCASGIYVNGAYGQRAFTVAEFDSKVDALAKALGVSV